MNKPMTEQPVIRCRHLAKIYTEGPAAVEVLKDINLDVAAGVLFLVIYGGYQFFWGPKKN